VTPHYATASKYFYVFLSNHIFAVASFILFYVAKEILFCCAGMVWVCSGIMSRQLILEFMGRGIESRQGLG
jgi:hypothetical protein